METKQGRILIVDDQPLNIEILRKLLRNDYVLESAENGAECLEKVQDFQPDLVLLDIMMPVLDGYEACRRIKSSEVGDLVQVILVSGKGSTSERLEGYNVQADDFVVKPFNHDELRSKVKIHFRLRASQKKALELARQVQMHNDQLEQLVEERTEQIVRTQDVSVFSLAQLADSRDPETGEHLLRMRAYSQILAEELSCCGPYTEQIDKAFLKNLYRASPLHDIGKVGIADSILLKPGKLTADEFEQMKQHVIVGAETLERAVATGGGEFLAMAAEVARFHHEKFDGSGYCAGRSGKDIPLSARIVALADVFDALTSARVYKDAMDPEQARRIIEEGEGSHFDPAIVAAFRTCYPELLKTKARIDGDSSPSARLLLSPASYQAISDILPHPQLV